MKPSALGLDGWSLPNLRSLPAMLLGWLAVRVREVESLGRWLARLAEGYTALLPKEGLSGPLNTRPLTVLSMVYRLWAGVRLADAVAWQASWTHPGVFGFPPAKSALDGAAVTQVLLELSCLRGWAVAGMSIDIKCFDLIPHAVVLAAHRLHCGALHQDKVHLLWDCPEWEQAKGTWRPRLTDAATASPNWGRRISGGPACGGRASSPSCWLRGWIGGSWLRLCTAYTACTLRSLQPAWLLAVGTRRATGTPCSRTSRVRGPATTLPGTTYRGTRSATKRASGQGPRRASDGPRTSCRAWSRGLGRSPGGRGRRKSPGLNRPWIVRHLQGGRSQPPRITDCRVRACRLGSRPKSCARRQS